MFRGWKMSQQVKSFVRSSLITLRATEKPTKTAVIVYIAEHAVRFHRPVKTPIVSKPHFS